MEITEKKCPMCEGTGVAKFVDLTKAEMKDGDSEYLSVLIEKYGEESECPDCTPCHSVCSN